MRFYQIMATSNSPKKMLVDGLMNQKAKEKQYSPISLICMKVFRTDFQFDVMLHSTKN
ncbi:hypothetical protein BDF21DRAFT_430307 [Thamnidium elegans]|nr:hypothetical protein BDF21DRAFT_430307 [Thamnidium elegans]